MIVGVFTPGPGPALTSLGVLEVAEITRVSPNFPHVFTPGPGLMLTSVLEVAEITRVSPLAPG